MAYFANHPVYIQSLLTKTAMTVLAIACCHYARTAKGEDIFITCIGQDGMFYAVPGSHCTSYYKCHSNKVERFECTSGSTFDYNRQECIRTPGVCYEPICTGRLDGTYSDTTHACRRSFTCRSGSLVKVNTCQPNHLFNGESCISSDYVVCELPETTAIAYAFSGDQRCTKRTDGVHLLTDDECPEYLICQNGKVIRQFKCPLNERYHSGVNQCRPKQQVPLWLTNQFGLCNGQNDGKIVDPKSTNCKTYLKCRNGVVESTESCGNLGIFNGDSCVPEVLYKCPSTVSSKHNELCKNQPNGFIANPSEGCSAYVKCINEKLVDSFQCPNGYYFDPESRNCIFEKFVERRRCMASSKPSTECAQMETGYYQDRTKESGCRKYFYCFNGNKIDYQCKLDSVFDGQKCISSNSYSCPTAINGSCTGQKNGYYKDLTAGCRAYYYCAEGRKYSYLCAEDQYFNGSKCILRHSGVNCSKSTDPCRDKPDGYFPDYQSRCRNYFYCLRGEKATTLTCRNNRIFNGQACVPTNKFTCLPPGTRNQDNINCIPYKCNTECKTDGFYADIDSGCRKYYFCTSGRKTIQHCSDGQVFNGDLCVSQHTYQCPRYCTHSTGTGKCPTD